MDDFLIKIRVLQQRHVKGKIKLLDKNYTRLNPYNPLTYLYMILDVLVCLFAFGFWGVYTGFKKRKNPFRWR